MCTRFQLLRAWTQPIQSHTYLFIALGEIFHNGCHALSYNYIHSADRHFFFPVQNETVYESRCRTIWKTSLEALTSLSHWKPNETCVVCLCELFACMQPTRICAGSHLEKGVLTGRRRCGPVFLGQTGRKTSASPCWLSPSHPAQRVRGGRGSWGS